MYKTTIAERLKFVNLCVLAVLLLGVGGAVFSQTLWQGTTYGMTMEQVKELFPSAIQEKKGKMVLKNHTVAEEPFDVSFLFNVELDDELNLLYKLYEVTLDLKKTGYAGETARKKLYSTLYLKYGQHTEKIEGTMMLRYKWITEETDITFLVDAPDYHNLRLSIKYGKGSLKEKMDALKKKIDDL
jgi:hypothetical protein